jgi:hypothetical protein
MASIDDRFAPAHLVDVFYDEDSAAEASFDRSAQRCRAECSCGWSGDWHDDAAVADGEGDEHRAIAVGPADPVDAFVSGLLDLADDLCRSVTWMAEHWSADLPVPSSRGSGDPVEVVLFAYCLSADELARAAEVLGVPLVDDPVPNSYGTRYRRATRHFGRVSFEVYREIADVCDECGTALREEHCPVCGQRRGVHPVTMGAA